MWMGPLRVSWWENVKAPGGLSVYNYHVNNLRVGNLAANLFTFWINVDKIFNVDFLFAGPPNHHHHIVSALAAALERQRVQVCHEVEEGRVDYDVHYLWVTYKQLLVVGNVHHHRLHCSDHSLPVSSSSLPHTPTQRQWYGSCVLLWQSIVNLNALRGQLQWGPVTYCDRTWKFQNIRFQPWTIGHCHV